MRSPAEITPWMLAEEFARWVRDAQIKQPYHGGWPLGGLRGWIPADVDRRTDVDEDDRKGETPGMSNCDTEAVTTTPSLKWTAPSNRPGTANGPGRVLPSRRGPAA